MVLKSCDKFKLPLGSEYELCSGCDVGEAADKKISPLPFYIETGGTGPVLNCRHMSSAAYNNPYSSVELKLEGLMLIEYILVKSEKILKLYGIRDRKGPYANMPVHVILNRFGLSKEMTKKEVDAAKTRLS